MAELEALEQEELDGTLLDVDVGHPLDNLPAVPRTEPKRPAKNDEEDELAQLRAEMAM